MSMPAMRATRAWPVSLRARGLKRLRRLTQLKDRFLQNGKGYAGSQLRRPEYSLSGALIIRVLCMVNIAIDLGIAIEHRKPAALHLDHDPMSLQECMVFISERKIQPGRFVRDHRFRI